MAVKEIKSRIQHKHDLEVNWLQATGFIPLLGEMIIYDKEVDSNGDVLLKDDKPLLPEGRTEPYTYERIKFGDGVKNVNDLDFFGEKTVVQIINWEAND